MYCNLLHPYRFPQGTSLHPCFAEKTVQSMGFLAQWQELRILDPPPALWTIALHCCPAHLPSLSQAKDFSLCRKPFNDCWCLISIQNCHFGGCLGEGFSSLKSPKMLRKCRSDQDLEAGGG